MDKNELVAFIVGGIIGALIFAFVAAALAVRIYTLANKLAD